MISPKSSTVVSGVAYCWSAWFGALVDDFGEIIHSSQVWLSVGQRGLKGKVDDFSEIIYGRVRCGLALASVVWSAGG